MTGRSTTIAPGLESVQDLLNTLHAEAEANDGPVLERFLHQAAERQATTEGELADVLADAYIPIDPECGRFLHVLARSRRPGRIVEFGTSMGLSTLYLAAALARGETPLITTEIDEGKVARAQENIERAGFESRVDLRSGDALTTLAELNEPVSLLYLDGWKDLYLPMLQLVERNLVDGAIVIADDTVLFADACRPLLEYLQSADSGYASASLSIGDGMEVAARHVGQRVGRGRRPQPFACSGRVAPRRQREWCSHSTASLRTRS